MFGLFTKRADPINLAKAGLAIRKLLASSMESGISIYETDISKVDEGIRDIVECQMLIVSLSTSIFNYALIDAYHHLGLADPLSGMPKIKPHHDDARLSLREAWSIFPTARLNLDMRYRYVYVKRLMSPGELSLWQKLELWSEEQARQHFEYKRPLDDGWVGFISALTRGDVAEAEKIIGVWS